MSKMSRSESGKLGAEKTNKLWRSRYLLNPKHCKFCDKVLDYEKRKNKFCDHSCSASFNNNGVTRHGQKRVNCECLVCKGSLGKNAKAFCSRTCQQKHQWEETKKEILTTGIAKFRHTAKKFLSETRGYKCEICDIAEWQNQKLSLVLDHINGHADDCRIENLRLLCPNCDSQTPTFKGRNLGKGRFIRRLRYKQGKSY